MLHMENDSPKVYPVFDLDMKLFLEKLFANEDFIAKLTRVISNEHADEEIKRIKRLFEAKMIKEEISEDRLNHYNPYK